MQCNWSYNKDIYPNLASVVPYQPLELCYIIPFLKKHNVKVIDAFLDNLSYAEVGRQVKEFQADAVVMDTANTYLFWRCCYLNIDVVKDTIRAIKKAGNPKCIILGPHGTVDSKWALKNTGADFVVRGEPEIAASNFINSNFDESTKGVASLRNLNNGIAEVTDLSVLDIPDYSYIQMERYRGHAWMDENNMLNKGALIEYSRGCPFYCSFCFRNGFRDKLRIRPAEKVIQEIAMIKEKYKINYFFFIDEMFNVDNENFRKLLDGLKGLDIKYGCQCRPDVMTKEVVDLMSESGCVYMEYGIESINKETAEKLGKNVNLKKVVSILNYSKKKIEKVVYNLLDFSTIDLILENNMNENENGALGFFSDTKALENIVFFPGTPLFCDLKSKLKVNCDSWELSTRLYWLSVKLKQNRDKSVGKRKMWKFVLLHFPMSIVKLMMSCKYFYAPLEISYGHEKDERFVDYGDRKK